MRDQTLPRYEVKIKALVDSDGLYDSDRLLHTSQSFDLSCFKMSLMFGKARTCNIVTVPEHEPSECNIVILGAMGTGKSGTTLCITYWLYPHNTFGGK